MGLRIHMYTVTKFNIYIYIYIYINYCKNLDFSRAYSRYNPISAADTGLSCRV